MIHSLIMKRSTWTREDERLFPTYHTKKGKEPNTRKKVFFHVYRPVKQNDRDISWRQYYWPGHLNFEVHGTSRTFFLLFPPSFLPINFSHSKVASLRIIIQKTKVFCGLVFILNKAIRDDVLILTRLKKKTLRVVHLTKKKIVLLFHFYGPDVSIVWLWFSFCKLFTACLREMKRRSCFTF